MIGFEARPEGTGRLEIEATPVNHFR